LLLAGESDVIKGTVAKSGKTDNFVVTASHQDEGWKYYLDKWGIVCLSGKVFAKRVLHHPHGNEQPFTSLIIRNIV